MSSSTETDIWPHDLTCYVDVLRAARTSVCHSWSRSDAATALTWSRHVRAAHLRRPLTESMRTASRAMGLPHPPTFEEDGTNGALESFRKEIFANVGVPDCVRKVVEESYRAEGADANGSRRLRKDLKRAAKPLEMFKEVERVGKSILQTLKESVVTEDGDKATAAVSKQQMELSYRCRPRTSIHIAAAKLICETASDRYQVFGTIPSNDDDTGTEPPAWLRTFLGEVEVFLIETPEGMETLIHLLLIMSPSNVDDPPVFQTPLVPLPSYFFRHLSRLFFSILHGEPSSNALAGCLQTMDPWLLARFSNLNFPFGEFYVDRLETWTMTSRMRSRERTEDVPPRMKKSKTHHDETSLSFKELERKWSALAYQDNPELNALVRSRLKCLFDPSDTIVENDEWKGLFQRLCSILL